MQVVIDIDENLYTRLFDNEDEDEDVTDMSRACVAIRKGTPIPENATNLDIAKQIYGKEVAIDLYNDLTMGRKWWNAPYKAGSEE